MHSDIEFSVDYYRSLLKSIAAGKYRFMDFQSNSNDTGGVFLRHDVDKSVSYALKMAQVENDFGVQAHYFFLLHTPLYNILEPETWSMIYEISQMGHAVGLHCDERIIPGASGDIDRDVMRDLHWLQTVFDFAKPLVSFHNPSERLLNRRPLVPYWSTYDPNYFQPKIKYISDSNRNFREGDPRTKLSNHEWPSVQMLIHPIWWFDNGKTTESILKKILYERLAQADNYLRYSNSVWAKAREKLCLVKTIMPDKHNCSAA